eukprot:2797458-Prymnesium_polylepis.1
MTHVALEQGGAPREVNIAKCRLCIPCVPTTHATSLGPASACASGEAEPEGEAALPKRVVSRLSD